MSTSAVQRIVDWRSNPEKFVIEVFQAVPEQWQAEALRAIVNEDKVSIRSGHGVGKSTFLAWLILWFLGTHPNAKVPTTAPTAHQLNDVLWAELGKWHRKMPPALRDSYTFKADRVEVGNSFAVARTARKENPEALQGFHADNLLFVIDEASGVEEIIFEVSEGALSSPGAKVVMCANPTRVSGYFYDSHHRMKARWHTMKVSCAESSRVSQAYIDDMRMKYGEDSDVFRVRVLGDFPVSDSDSVIPLDLIEAAANRDVEPKRTLMPVWGLDVARFGNCRTALVKRWGNHVIETKTWRKRDTMEVAGIVLREYEDAPSDLRPAAICVDSIGVGAGVADRLRELELPVIAVNVGEAPSGQGRFLNLRAELWWRAREWLEDRDSKITSEELCAELSIVKQKITSNGKIKIEGKDEMMDRGVDSPDIADAFVLTFAHADRRKEHARYDRYTKKSGKAAWAA